MPPPDPASPQSPVGPEPQGPEPLDLPAGVHQLCRCGLSRHGWFCDGAHLGSGQVSRELRLQSASRVWMCRCGRSRQRPLCDGSHAEPLRRRRWRWPWQSRTESIDGSPGRS